MKLRNELTRLGNFFITNSSCTCRNYALVSKETKYKSQNPTSLDNSKIAMISNNLRRYLFFGLPMKDALDETERFLSEFAPLQKLDQKSSSYNDVQPLISDHFHAIATYQSLPYWKLLKRLTQDNIPELPEKWKVEAGWTRYEKTGDGVINCVAVEYPQEDAFVFDVEILVPESPLPIMAVALSNAAWYSWISPRYFQEEFHSHLMYDAHTGFIPIGRSTQPRIVVGHNVGFDRSRIAEQYSYELDSTRFWDTMATHIALCGMEQSQITEYKTLKSFFERKRKATQQMLQEQSTEVEFKSLLKDSDIKKKYPLLMKTSMNSLKDSHSFHCNVTVEEEELDKSMRSIFINGDIATVRDNVQELLKYCALDVKATWELHRETFIKFQKKFKHPATLNGMLHMGSTILPTNENWCKFIEASDNAMKAVDEDVAQLINTLAHDAVQRLQPDDTYLTDPWMWCANWKKSTSKTQNEINTQPKWLKELKPKSGEHKTSRVQVLPQLLQLCWCGSPLVYMKGWGFYNFNVINVELLIERTAGRNVKYFLAPTVTMVPLDDTEYQHLFGIRNSDSLKLNFEKHCKNSFPLLEIHRTIMNNQSAKSYLDSYQPNHTNSQPIAIYAMEERTDGQLHSLPLGDLALELVTFVKLPHPVKINENVGDPLTVKMQDYFDEGRLHTQNTDKLDVLRQIRKQSSIATSWRSMRNRAHNQMLCQYDANCSAIVPEICVAGTLTRRAVERIWQVAPNPNQMQIGSEIKAMVQAPPGSVFVGADVDSQEQWIACVIGDAYEYRHVKKGAMPMDCLPGVTPISKMLLLGNKIDGTDNHSMVAKLLNISRDTAKTLNYGRLYGAGPSVAMALLKKDNPQLTSEELTEKINTLFKETKGTRWSMVKLHGKFLEHFKSIEFDLYRRENNVAGAYFPDTGIIYLTKQGYKSKLVKIFMQYLAKENVISENMVNPKVPIRTITENYPNEIEHIAGEWKNGAESAIFNGLEEIANSTHPRTPVLRCPISDALTVKPLFNQENNVNPMEALMRTRINWVVQSSAVDFLHLLLTQTQDLIQRWHLTSARFIISVHDEVRYMCSEEEAPLLALALHVANLYTRVMVSHQLGLTTLPLNVATFSAVDIDSCLRKDPLQKCVTPTCPQGIEVEYGISPGRSLTFEEVYKLAMPLLNERLPLENYNK